LRIKLWGVRGSIPTPLSTEQLREKLFRAVSGAAGVDLTDPAGVHAYIAGLSPVVNGVVGGNTTCVEVDTGTDTIIIDGGSGMRPLGYSLMARGFGKGQGVAHIFLTHAHWDHLQGYPFFLPAYVPGNKLIFYAVNYNPQLYLEHQQVAPMYFPIPPNAMPADKEFVQLREGETVQIGRTVVSSLALYHPGTAYAYRFDDGESVFVFASDGEYKSLAEANLRRYVDFFAHADALVFDSQYSLRDVFLSKADWGHSSAIIGVDIAERARVKKLITFHHDPTHSDEQIFKIAEAAREYALVNELSFNTEVLVGTEGLELFLGQPLSLEIMEERGEAVWTLALAGHLNQKSSGDAQRRVAEALADAPAGRVLADLTLLATLDAVGAKALVDAARAHPKAQLAVLAPTLHIRRVLEQSGVAEALRLFRTRQQAVTALAGPEHLRLAAETIGGLYQLDELLFADEAGVIYGGSERGTAAPLLVRVVAGRPTDPVRSSFAQQAREWRQAHHPGLLPCKDVVNDVSWIAFICPRPEGASLREWWSRRPPWRALWEAAGQLCHALAALHRHNVVHGDLRPEKILVGADGVVQIGRAPLFPHPTGFGPAAYRAPEQLRGHAATLRTDVYLLGLVLYELLLGAPAFAAESEELRLTLQLYSLPQSPRTHWPEIPVELEALLLRMLAVAPEDRFESAQGVAAIYDHLAQMVLPRAGEGSRRGINPLSRPA
jgi:phosphoribosyl 1,2-cyclic phosphodiesterase/anti-anti-sigma regulatory factor